MADSSIEWTDATWNPVRGCKPISPGCGNCYAELMTGRLEAMGQDGYAGLTKPGTGKKRFLFNGQFRTAPDRLEDPLGWKKPRMVFVNSMSDLFGEGVPFEFIAAVFGVMAACPQHTFQVLTKRADRMLEFFEAHSDAKNAVANVVATAIMMGTQSATAMRLFHEGGTWPLPNVWLGVSTENQECADKRIPALLKTPAAVRFLSLEPMLGPISLTEIDLPRTGHTQTIDALTCDEDNMDDDEFNGRSIDWVIVGGESGPSARPCGLRWIADIVAQCKAAGVPCFVKQLGSNPQRDGWRIKLSSKGGNRNEWPKECQEWPREWPMKVV